MSNLQSRLLDAADDMTKAAESLRAVARELPEEGSASDPAAQTKVPAADAAASEPPFGNITFATWEQVVELHKLIKGHTRNRSWRATLDGCGMLRPDGLVEPANEAELRTFCSWLSAADAASMTARIKSTIK